MGLLKKIFGLEKERVKDGIDIVGSDYFISATDQALTLLIQKDVDNFKRVQRQIRKIFQTKSRFKIGYKNYTYGVDSKTAFYSTTWYASCIVHESVHGELRNRSKIFSFWNSNILNPETLQREELACIKVQIRCLKKIGAPHKEIVHAERGDGLHFLNSEHYPQNRF